MKYIITIEETISQDFEIEATDIEEALKIAENNYLKEKIVLAPGNLVCKQICAISQKGDVAVNWREF